MLRIGHVILIGKTTLTKQTVIDVLDEYDGIKRYLVYDHQTNKIKETRLDNENIFSILSNGIDRPETQDKIGRFTIGDGDCETHMNKIKMVKK